MRKSRHCHTESKLLQWDGLLSSGRKAKKTRTPGFFSSALRRRLKSLWKAICLQSLYILISQEDERLCEEWIPPYS